MLHRWRRYYNLDTSGGGGVVDTLDSPGPSDSVITVNTDDIDTGKAAGGDITNNTDKSTDNNPNADKSTDADKSADGANTDKQAGDNTGDDTNIYALADEQLGYGVGVDDLPEGIDGLAEFGKRSYEKGAEDAVKKEWEEFSQRNPAAVELAKWLESGRSETEFYLSKVQSPRIEPDALNAETPVSELEKVVYNHFIKQGTSERMAKQYTQMAVDANTILEDAKEIVKANNAKEDAEKAASEAATQAERTREYNEFVQRVEAEIAEVKTGKLGNITIPQAEVDAFIQANYMDAQNPEYPGMSEVDIMLSQFSSQERSLHRYLAWKKLNLDGLVTARAKTINVKDVILKGGSGGSNMSGSANRKAVADDRTLDSPGT